MKIDLNCDLGESFGRYTLGLDQEVLPFVSSANVACGFHASDPVVMLETVQAAKSHHVAIGAHPGYPDLVGFGRRDLSVSPKELQAMVMYQIGALSAFCQGPLQHVKPHGAMYNMAAKDEKLARAICEGVAAVDDRLILMGLSGSCLIDVAQSMGLRCAREVFADRGYREDGSLVPRREAGALITDEDEAIARVIAMVKEGTVRTVTGKVIPVAADSVCLHGDGEKAVAFARRIHDALEKAGVEIAPLSEIVQ